MKQIRLEIFGSPQFPSEIIVRKIAGRWQFSGDGANEWPIWILNIAVTVVTKEIIKDLYQYLKGCTLHLGSEAYPIDRLTEKQKDELAEKLARTVE